MRIRRRCICGCGQITSLGRRWRSGHNGSGIKLSKETRDKLSSAMMGNTNGKGLKGYKQTEEHKLKISLSKIKPHPDDEYCEVWRSREYKRDLRKGYCEDIDCKGIYKKLGNHHINLNKKDCRPCNIMTLCDPCHMHLHRQLELGRKQKADYKEYLTIIRPNRITYIHKEIKTKIILNRRNNHAYP